MSPRKKKEDIYVHAYPSMALTQDLDLVSAQPQLRDGLNAEIKFHCTPVYVIDKNNFFRT